jgi:beta-lactam-binding protein with PASTA domain
LITLLPLLIIAAVLILLLMPKKVVVPDLTKAASRFAVEQQLQKAGLNPVPQVEKVTTGGKPGQIIAQSPAAGKKVSKNTLVTIQVVVGTGLVTAPNVVGMKVKDAAGALDAVGLKLGEMLPPPPDPDATIGSQIPPAGKQVHPGDAIAVFVVHAKGGAGKAAAGGAAAGGAAAGGAAGAGGANAAGGKPAPVPAVAGKSVADAAAALAAAGMLPVTVQRYDASKPGTLVRTVPAAGAKVPPGTTVTLIVSAGFPQLVFDAPTGLMSVTGPAQPALLAGTQPGDGEATWSADGTHIAYVSGRDIVVAAPGKPGSVVLRGGGAAFRDPAFAPAGRVLAVTKRTNGDGDLCLATVSGATQADCISEPNIDVGRSVSWSHDGKEILVAGHPKGKPQNFGLVLYRSNVPFSPHAADWGKGVPVTDVSRTGVGALAGAFSPDGKQLAIGSNAGGGGFQLYITTPDDFKLGNAKSFAVAACAVAWRPDSQQLAVVTNPDCPSANNGQVVLVDPAHPQRLAPVAANGAHPAWQPLALTGG